jgi:hypothetical protein
MPTPLPTDAIKGSAGFARNGWVQCHHRQTNARALDDTESAGGRFWRHWSEDVIWKGFGHGWTQMHTDENQNRRGAWLTKAVEPRPGGLVSGRESFVGITERFHGCG